MELSSLPLQPYGIDVGVSGAQARSGDPRAIDKVATGFESMFLSLMLKEMRQSLEPETLFGGDSGDVLGGLFDLFLGQHLSQSGSLGIAAMVKQSVQRMHDAQARERGS